MQKKCLQMDFSNPAWLQQSLDLSHVASDGQHTTHEEWKDPSGASAAMDLGDFGLGDLSGEHVLPCP